MGFNFKTADGIEKKDLEKLKVLGRVYFYFLFFYSGLEFTLTFLTHLRFDFDAGQQGKMLLFVGLVMAFLQGGLVRRVQPGKEKLLAMIGLAVIIPSFFIIGLASNTTVLYLGLATYSFGSAIIFPSLTAMTAAYGRADQKGAVMGTLRSLGSLARGVGPLASSFAFFVYGAELCYGLGACALLVPLFLLARLTIWGNAAIIGESSDLVIEFKKSKSNKNSTYIRPKPVELLQHPLPPGGCLLFTM